MVTNARKEAILGYLRDLQDEEVFQRIETFISLLHPKPLSAEALKAQLDEGERAIREGRVTPHEEFKAEFKEMINRRRNERAS